MRRKSKGVRKASKTIGAHAVRTITGVLITLALAACGAAPDTAPAPADGDTDTAGAARPEAPASPAPDTTAPPGEADTDEPPGASWTAGRLAGTGAEAGVATLRALRTARHEDFDRIVFDFGNDPLPSWEVQYIDRPVRQCGSGDAVPVAGDGWLSIHMQPARAHDDAGQATVGERRRSLPLGVLRELVATCDFEAHLEWVAGAGSPNAFRVFELRGPSRIVVDVRHGR